jgi:GT2 family glycosyltransferase
MNLKPKIGIIYLTYNTKNSAEEIPRCFRSLQKMSYPLDRVELICVENQSPHGASWPMIERDWLPEVGKTLPNITIKKNQDDVGYAGANNVGIGIAIELGCEYVFLLNQDTEVESDFLEAAVARAEADEKIGYVQSLVLLGQEKNRVNSVGNRYHFLGYGYAGGYRWTRERAEQFFTEQRVTNPELQLMTWSGCAVLVRVSMARQIGLFDGRFYMYHEDMDASFNGKIHGWKSVIEPKSVVYHYYQFSKSIKKFYWMERNRFVFILSYYKVPTLALIAFPLFCVETLSFLLAIRGGWWREKARSWGYFFRLDSWRWVTTRRRKIQAERQISDRVLLRQAVGDILFQDESQTDSQDDGGIKKDVNSRIVTRVGNPILRTLWKVIYSCIRW